MFIRLHHVGLLVKDLNETKKLYCDQFGLKPGREFDLVKEDVRICGQSNAIDPGSGWKADYIIRNHRPFSIAEFDDRQPLRFLGLELSVARAEDLIVAKLERAKHGDSAFRDR